MNSKRKTGGYRRKPQGEAEANSAKTKNFKNRSKKRIHDGDKEGKSFRGKKSGRGGRFSGGGKRRNRGGGGRGRGKNKKAIPVHKFVHKGVPVQEVKYEALSPYRDFPLHKDLQKNIEILGYKMPTEVQEKTFEHISEVRDVMAIANTGTGKTAAFLIPLINAMLFSDERFSALVMVPTRELAQQVEEEFRKLSKKMKLFGACFIGGQSINNDLRKLRKNFDFVIGTPGRLVDLSKRKALKFENFSVLVLDEFDRMLDMGFSQDVNFITNQMTSRDQTLLFSATLDKTQEELINNILTNPVKIQVTDGKSTAEHIDQDVVFFERDNKLTLLVDMLKDDEYEKVLVFSETKRGVSDLTRKLKRKKFKVDEIHGDKTQNYRKHALRDFKRGKVNILVATDVAARGLDISDVSHVINYQVPQDYETYIHRIGRTGRAGKTGKAYTFVEGKAKK